MKTEIKLIKWLIPNRQPQTIRQLADAIKADYKITHTAVKMLSRKGIIEEKHIGKAIVVVLKRRVSKELFLAEYERTEELQKFADIRILAEIVNKQIKTAYYVLLIFGSFAKGKAKPNSDIDIMLIVPKMFEKDAERAVGFLPKRIHATILSEFEFVKMNDNKEPNVVHECMKNNVILYGMEQFYSLTR